MSHGKLQYKLSLQLAITHINVLNSNHSKTRVFNYYPSTFGVELSCMCVSASILRCVGSSLDLFIL